MNTNPLLVEYEQQYSILTAEITTNIGKLNAFSVGDDADEEKRSALITRINSQITDVKDLLEQIVLESRYATTREEKLRHRCYEVEFNRLKNELILAIDRKAKDTDEFETSDFDDVGMGDEQKNRLLVTSERIERTGNLLAEGYKTIVETEQIGSTVLEDLSQHRETIQRTRSRIRDANERLGISSRILNMMMAHSIRERIILTVIVIIIFIVICMSIYLSISK